MNKIVREHYPVEKLPEDLRADLPAGASVTVEITAESDPQLNTPPLATTAEEAVALIRQLQHQKTGKGRSMEDIVAEIRVLRDEWDD